VQNNRGCLSRFNVLKFSDHPFKNYDLKNVRTIDVKIGLPIALDRILI
jgi:hypothetical protein